MHHRTEDIHRHDSRPFLKDPKWPRDDISANFTCWRDKEPPKDVSIFNLDNLSFNVYFVLFLGETEQDVKPADGCLNEGRECHN